MGKDMAVQIGRGHIAQELLVERLVGNRLAIEYQHVVTQFDCVTGNADDALYQPFFVIRRKEDRDVTSLRVRPLARCQVVNGTLRSYASLFT